MNLNSGVTVIATQCKLYPADINFFVAEMPSRFWISQRSLMALKHTPELKSLQL